MHDVVVIGAGLSGLTAASQLQKWGYRVLVVDKSRGLGGRLATRRRGATAIDHGCRYLQPFTEPDLSPMATLQAAGVLQPWRPDCFALGADGTLTAMPTEEYFAAPQGMSAVAKALAAGLTIHSHWRATALTPLPEGWCIAGEPLGDGDPTTTLEARAVVLAIPAPQAMALLEPAARHGAPSGAIPSGAIDELIQRLDAVAFEAVITVMAGYDPQISAVLPAQGGAAGWLVEGKTHPLMRWMALDSSKRAGAEEPVVVLHSSAAFAAANIDRPDLETVGNELLTAAAQLAAWLSTPAWMQVHRWRYGFVSRPLGWPVLRLPDLPTLVGCGDWCQGNNAEGAIAAGLEAARAIAPTLQRSNPTA